MKGACGSVVRPSASNAVDHPQSISKWLPNLQRCSGTLAHVAVVT
jgi:hypothetical protein